MTRNLRLTILLTLFTLSAFAQRQTLSNLINDDAIPGIQLVYARGNKTQAYNIGVISKGSTQKVTSNTIFEAASLSKSVFSYIVLRLYDRGIIDLDKPLLQYIGSYNRFDPNDPRYGKITARMVMEHHTGLPNWGDDKGVRLIFTPDSTFSYSGEGFQYLQYVVEKITGKPLNELAQQEVFTPLGMTSSNYHWVSKYDTVAAFGNSAEAVNRHKNTNAAYSLLTNAHDYSLFLQALINGEGLKPATREMMFEKMSDGNWYKHDVTEANNHIGWGLGVGLMKNETGKWIWHWGDNGDFKCFYIASPDKRQSLVYFTYNNFGLMIMPDVLTEFFGKQTWWMSKWLSYDFKASASMRAYRAQLKKRGFDEAENIYNEMKAAQPDLKLPENDLNDFGFMLMDGNRAKDALEIFKLNLKLNPTSANAFDSIAEAYEALGEKELALRNFKKTYEMNPKNSYAAEHIKKLEGEIKN